MYIYIYIYIHFDINKIYKSKNADQLGTCFCMSCNDSVLNSNYP